MSVCRFLLVLTAASMAVFAQSSSSITGQITDVSKAPLPGAKIIVEAVQTGVKIRTTANEQGYYTVPSLQPTQYTLTAVFEGFETGVSPEFKLNTTDTARVDLSLRPAGMQQSVEVSAQVSNIETQSGMTGTTVSTKEIETMPLDGRNSLALALTIPGISGDVGSDEGGIFQTTPSAGANLVISGGRTASSAFMADGASATSVTLGRQTVTFSSDTIQEFKVITSSFSAQYGVSGGGIVSTISKSGSNSFHGSLFYYQRNPTIAARQFNSPIPPPFRRNEGGVTVGGPVWLPKIYNGHNKTFFFFSYEPKRWRDGAVNYIRVPTAAERQGDFRSMWVAPGQTIPLIYQQVQCADSACGKLSQLNRANNTAVYPLFSAGISGVEGLVIPKQYLDPLAQKLLQDVPMPNSAYDTNGNNYFGQRGVSGRDNRWNLKIDHNFSSANRLTARYTHIPNFSERYLYIPKDYSFGSYPSDTSYTRQAYVSDTHTISSHIVNEFRGNFTYSDYSSIAPGDLGVHNYTKDFGLPNITSWGYPRFSFSGTTYLQPSIGMGNNQLLGTYLEQQTQFADDLTITHGRHTITTGIDWRFMQSNVKAGGLGDACCGNYTFNGTATQSGNANIPTGAGGNAFASFLLGVPSSAALRGIIVPYYYRWRTGAAFVQDDFKVTSALTLNLGLRWQYTSPRAEKDNRQASIDIDHPVALTDAQGRNTGYTLNYQFAGAGGSRYLEPVHKAGFEPRFGFAWSPRFGGSGAQVFVVRGGYGISHLPQTGRGRDPLPDFGAGSGGTWNYVQWTGTGAQPVTQSQNPQSLIGIGRNAPVVIADPRILQIPSSGVLCAGCTPIDPRIPGGNLVAFLKSNAASYIQTWNLTMQKGLPGNYTMTLTYMGQKGTHLYSGLFNINNPDLQKYQTLLDQGGDPSQSVPDPFGRVDASGNLRNTTLQDLMRPYPTLGDITVVGATNSNSTYHAGIVEVERRFRGSYGFRFNYTWSKSIDNSSNGQTDSGPWTFGRFQNSYDLKANRSVSFYDTRHRLNLTANLNLPLGRGRFALRQKLLNELFLANWSINDLTSYYSGIPFGPFLGDNNGIPGGSTRPQVIFPDMVQGVPLINPRWNKNVANTVPYINPQAFARPMFGRLGNSGRTLDYLRFPWSQNNNMSVFKEIHPFENRTRYFQLRGEFFNVFNHAYFQMNQNSSVNIFTGALPLSRTGVSLAGPLPYLPGSAGTYPAGTREAYLATAYNQNFGLFQQGNNSPGRIIQIALKFIW